MMFNLLKMVSDVSGRISLSVASKSAPAQRQSRRFRPVGGLERLEGRDVPSSFADPMMGANAVTITVSNQDNTPPAPTGPLINFPPVDANNTPTDPGSLILVPPPAPTDPVTFPGPIMA
jgi:hypothetical protein